MTKHRKRLMVWIFLFLCLLIVAGPLSLHISSIIPRVKRRNVPSDVFSEERAHDYLNKLTQYGSRVIHTRGNNDARHFLIREIEKIFSMNKRDLRLEVDLQNFTVGDHYQLENILVRVSNGKKEVKNESSLMVCAHYDTVEFSPGSCDDGSGVVILLELLSNLINDLRINFSNVHLIVLLTNAEETGSEGAQAFINGHGWRSNIHRFIYIDAASCNEKASLVRLKPSKLVMDYSQVPRPRGNMIFQNILEHFGLRGDYDSYILNGSLSGYEFAFIFDGYTYHTTHDDLSNIKEGVFQDLGDNLAVLIRNILLEDIQKIEELIDEDSLIFFDVYSRYLVLYKMSTSIIIQKILIILTIVIGLFLIIFDEISHRKRSSLCNNCHCIYFHFKYSLCIRILSIILYFISNLFSLFSALLLSTLFAWIMSILRPLSWFANPTLAIFLFSLPSFIAFIANAYLWNLLHQVILRKFPKSTQRSDLILPVDHFNEINFHFERNVSILFIYALLMIISVSSKNELFYIILVWSIFVCPIYLLVMIIEFVIDWNDIHLNLFERRDYWLYLPLIVSLFPLTHTIETLNRLIRFLIPILSKRFSFGFWSIYSNIIICNVIVVPLTLFGLILIPILQRTKYFGGTLILLLITFCITVLLACLRQPFTDVHPNIFYAQHKSKSIFKLTSLSNVPFDVPLISQSSSITVMTYDGLPLSPVLDHFSAKSKEILQNKRCSKETNCRFDDTFNRTIGVQSILIESIKNLTNYTIIIKHLLSYNIRISSFPFVQLNIRNRLIVPRTETIIDVTLNWTLSWFEINMNIKRCDFNHSPFLLLFTRFISNMVPIGKGHCQAIDDDATLIIDLNRFSK